MGIVRWDPFNELSSMRHMIDRYLDHFWGRGARHDLAGTTGFGPRIDVYQTEDEVIATAELPGIQAKDDIDVRIDNDKLTIRGEFKRSQDLKEEHSVYNERYFGTFTRVIQLPARVRPEQARATYNNGILEIRMAKSDPGENWGRRIPVQ
ncbi:MAG: Hsp20/alpha crystallin family protein [Peptococcaceae bacterium]|nr:Hsp20/alpha crystallin family protein [Peptococcaceae bacterium]